MIITDPHAVAAPVIGTPAPQSGPASRSRPPRRRPGGIVTIGHPSLREPDDLPPVFQVPDDARQAEPPSFAMRRAAPSPVNPASDGTAVRGSRPTRRRSPMISTRPPQRVPAETGLRAGEVYPGPTRRAGASGR